MKNSPVTTSPKMGRKEVINEQIRKLVDDRDEKRRAMADIKYDLAIIEDHVAHTLIDSGMTMYLTINWRKLQRDM